MFSGNRMFCGACAKTVKVLHVCRITFENQVVEVNFCPNCAMQLGFHELNGYHISFDVILRAMRAARVRRTDEKAEKVS